MKSSYDILSALYQVIRPVVAGQITGGVFIGDEPEEDQKENITLNLITNPINYVQTAVCNVNVHVWGQHEKLPNHARMKALVDLILPLVDNATHEVEGTTLHIEIADDKGVFENQENRGKYFYNLRINCITL